MTADQSLVVAPAWVGDLVMAEALTARLADRGERVTMLVSRALAPLAERMPSVAAVVPHDFLSGELGLGKRRALAARLRREGAVASAAAPGTAPFTRAYVLPNSWKSALVPWLARIPERRGWLGEQRFGLLTHRPRLDAERYPLMVERFVALADATVAAQRITPPTLVHDPARAALLSAELELELELERGEAVVAFAPGADYGPAKRWPVAHFAALAATLAAQGVAVWIFGGPADQPLGEQIRAEALERLQASDGGSALGQDAARRRVVSLCGRTRFDEAVDLLATVDALVCNDTGLLHVGAALGRPVVAIYGSSSPAFTPPLTAQATTLSRSLPCSPCFARTCPLGHTRCLTELEPAAVLEALHTLLARTAAVASSASPVGSGA
ncbi:MAG: lipopolysaccharide heptosyltransferase II [Pseudomonadota bacterium]